MLLSLFQTGSFGVCSFCLFGMLWLDDSGFYLPIADGSLLCEIAGPTSHDKGVWWVGEIPEPYPHV